MFDANDFDETLPGPWEWDVKRLGASMVIAGRSERFHRRRECRDAAMAAVRCYREWMARYAGMSLIDVWYAAITDADMRDDVEQSALLAGKIGGAAPRVRSKRCSPRLAGMMAIKRRRDR